MKTIGNEMKFYGYIVALQAEPVMTATFQYGEKRTTWKVPDAKLFRALALRLTSMAICKTKFETWGYDKLDICKTKGGWYVETP